jgi:energy-coupling factor transporter ATP-binding protein EcfA2
MRLVSIKYSEFEQKPKEWNLDNLLLNQITLIVGKNASGKTRTLNIINNLARLIRGDNKPTYESGNFNAYFNDEGDDYRYKIFIQNGKVVEEEFESKGKILLTRGTNGIGKIFAFKLNKEIDFQTPPEDIALTSRRDNIQHPFFEPLYNWASSVFHYEFGKSLGKDIWGLFKNDATKVDPRNTSYVVYIYKQGENEFGDIFKNVIKKDLDTIGYHISDIGLAAPSKIMTVEPPLTGELMGLWIQEEGLKGKIEQDDISQGMFRAFSLIIQLNYSIMALKPACILIDDIGEGLDFERSCSLINLLLDKVKGTKTQLIMTTNDRFVMNTVPLEMWTVLHRENSHCKIINIQNAKEKFEQFRFTGLNNFDFFATDYLNEEKNK